MPHILRHLHYAPAREASPPALHRRPDPRHMPRARIEALTLALPARIILDIIPHRKQRRKRIREIQQRGSGDHAHEAEIIRDGGRDDEGDGPPDGHDDGVEDFSAARD